MMQIGNPLNFVTLRDLARGGVALSLSEAAYAAVERGAQTVAGIVKRGTPAYGVNTGFGRLAQTHIPNEQLELLQSNLVLSHAVGVGAALPAPVVRLMLALKIQALSRGYSGVRRVLVDALLKLYNADVLPRVPAKGSVGASGDLAPLAHMSTVLLGVGEVECAGEILSADEGLKRAGLTRLKLAAKEGLALLNGTQTSTALALVNLFAIDNLYATALVSGALSVDAAEGSASPFDARLQSLDHAVHQLCQTEGAPVDRHLARLQLAVIEQVVDQRAQVLGGGAQRADVSLLTGIELGLLEQLRKHRDGVQGRADLVADEGQQPGLRLRLLLSVATCQKQLPLILAAI